MLNYTYRIGLINYIGNESLSVVGINTGVAVSVLIGI